MLIIIGVLFLGLGVLCTKIGSKLLFDIVNACTEKIKEKASGN